MIFKAKMWSNKSLATKTGTSAAAAEGTPTNAVLVSMAKDYKDKLPALLGPGIDNTRTFFLADIAPAVMAMTNGLQDGLDVLRQAMEEEPQASKYFNAMNNMLDVALRTKMANFVANHCNLSLEERTIFLKEVFTAPQETSTAKIIKELAISGSQDTPLGSAPKVDRRGRARLAKLGELQKEAASK